jgi:hypothetical protein
VYINLGYARKSLKKINRFGACSGQPEKKENKTKNKS